MVILVVHHFVRDFDTWKPVFDEHEAVRRSHGEVEHRLFQDPGNPNRLVVHNDFESEEAARGFMTDPSLAEAMERAGVEGEPGIGLAVLSERKRYTDGTAGVTLVIHHRVRDFGAWKPVFDEHEDVRRGHGEIEHRVYQGYGDPESVIVHNDFPSREAAEAFMADPSLADAMERAGVEGRPGSGFLCMIERKVYAETPVA
jgi:quinol monooxygenase YgiN